MASAKTNARIIVDRLAAHRENSIHQVNPLIPQSIWDNCRPSLCDRRNMKVYGIDRTDNDIENEFEDTYALICNMNVPVFNGIKDTKNNRHGEAGSSQKINELQRLSIVRLMHNGDGEFQCGDEAVVGGVKVKKSQLYRDFLFSPTHSLHSELCMREL
jgi:hypothetical protein